MAVIVIASILFVIPFLLVSLFEDKKRGFIYVLFFLLIFHTALAFFTQLFGVFYYQIIVTITVLADVAVIGYFLYVVKRRQVNVKNIVKKRLPIDWMVLAVIFISVASLYQVHYNYTGKISLVGDAPNEYHDVENMKYPYPYFSDEWYTISLVNSSLDSHRLPFKNPLNGGLFINLEVFSHALLAQVALLFKLNLLLHYTAISIVVNTLVIVLAYLLLRAHRVSKISSSVAALSILYITSGANLPGIWNLLPVTFGILFSLMLFYCISAKDNNMAFLSFVAASLFYGLLLPFYGLVMAVFLLSQLPKDRKTLFRVLGVLAALLFLVIPLGWIVLVLSPAGGFAGYLAGKLFYLPFLGDFMHQFNIFYIVPVPILLLAIAGLPFITKQKKWLLLLLGAGCAYWALYSFVSYRFIIEFERVVFLTSIVIALVAGFGLDRVMHRVSLLFGNTSWVASRYGGVLVVILFLLLAPSYTSHGNWLQLVSINYASGDRGVPRAPANNYLTGDDIRIFDGIKYKKFLSVPWKGTVIGIATQNYPLVVKAGTIHFGVDSDADVFLQSDCAGKKAMAQAKGLDYVYLYHFECAGFKKADESPEGFVLYEVIK